MLITILASAAVRLLLGIPLAGIPLSVALYSLVGTGLVASTLHLYNELRPEERLPAAMPAPRPTEEAAPT